MNSIERYAFAQAEAQDFLEYQEFESVIQAVETTVEDTEAYWQGYEPHSILVKRIIDKDLANAKSSGLLVLPNQVLIPQRYSLMMRALGMDAQVDQNSDEAHLAWTHATQFQPSDILMHPVQRDRLYNGYVLSWEQLLEVMYDDYVRAREYKRTTRR